MTSQRLENIVNGMKTLRRFVLFCFVLIHLTIPLHTLELYRRYVYGYVPLRRLGLYRRYIYGYVPLHNISADYVTLRNQRNTADGYTLHNQQALQLGKLTP